MKSSISQSVKEINMIKKGKLEAKPVEDLLNEIDQEWLLVAKQRAKDLDDGSVEAVSAKEVQDKVKSLLS